MAKRTDLFYVTKSSFRKERKRENERIENGYNIWNGFIPVFVGGSKTYYSGHNGIACFCPATEWYYDSVPAISLKDRSIWLIDIAVLTCDTLEYRFKKPTGKRFRNRKDLLDL